ncbi:hypothetical protein CN275_00535 [Bacillus anthracis]|nr:hypothetical protein CN275_00535 [Bacillus anthracis]PFR03842.1 hypothetical protein COK10_25135 [Bacillus anthracis]
MINDKKFKELLIDACNLFYTQFSVGRYSKKQWDILINKFANDTIESGRYKNVSEDKIKGYAYKSLETICDNSDYKYSQEFLEYQEVMKEISSNTSNESVSFSGLYNWL